MIIYRRLFVTCFLLASLALPGGVTLAFNPDEVLKDPALEARARTLSTQLRCLVCQNQSIDDSNATLARDLRLLVRERLVEGDTNNQVLDYMVARYGEFVLMRPRITPRTYILWFAPAVLLLIGAIAIVILMRRRVAAAKTAGPVVLSEAEERELEKLLKK